MFLLETSPLFICSTTTTGTYPLSLSLFIINLFICSTTTTGTRRQGTRRPPAVASPRTSAATTLTSIVISLSNNSKLVLRVLLSPPQTKIFISSQIGKVPDYWRRRLEYRRQCLFNKTGISANVKSPIELEQLVSRYTYQCLCCYLIPSKDNPKTPSLIKRKCPKNKERKLLQLRQDGSVRSPPPSQAR